VPAPTVSVAGESAPWVDPAVIPSPSDIGRLGRALRAHGEQHDLMASLAAYSGLRWGELSALTVGQVDKPGRVITVDRKVVEVSGHLYVEGGQPIPVVLRQPGTVEARQIRQFCSTHGSAGHASNTAQNDGSRSLLSATYGNQVRLCPLAASLPRKGGASGGSTARRSIRTPAQMTTAMNHAAYVAA
jgi:hypothetical protein